jgi:hypothetical protein
MHYQELHSPDDTSIVPNKLSLFFVWAFFMFTPSMPPRISLMKLNKESYFLMDGSGIQPEKQCNLWKSSRLLSSPLEGALVLWTDLGVLPRGTGVRSSSSVAGVNIPAEGSSGDNRVSSKPLSNLRTKTISIWWRKVTVGHSLLRMIRT